MHRKGHKYVNLWKKIKAMKKQQTENTSPTTIYHYFISANTLITN